MSEINIELVYFKSNKPYIDKGEHVYQVTHNTSTGMSQTKPIPVGGGPMPAVKI